MAVSTLKPEVKVTLDRERHLRYDLNAHIAFQEQFGHDLLEDVRKISPPRSEDENEPPKMPDWRAVRNILWAGLVSETLDVNGNQTSETLTIQQVGTMLSVGSMVELMQSIGSAFTVAMPPPSGEPERPTLALAKGRNKSRSTGASSGVSRTSSSASKATQNSAA